ncbi:hypothetical protein D3C72_1693700 [compost metagenome]
MAEAVEALVLAVAPVVQHQAAGEALVAPHEDGHVEAGAHGELAVGQDIVTSVDAVAQIGEQAEAPHVARIAHMHAVAYHAAPGGSGRDHPGGRVDMGGIGGAGIRHQAAGDGAPRHVDGGRCRPHFAAPA